MLRIKSNTLSGDDKRKLGYIFYDICDAYGDFYLTKDNIRIPFRDNQEVFYECLEKGDKLIYDDEREDAVAIVTGYSDKAPRKYLKILSKSEEAVGRILKFLNWHIKQPIFIKIKKNNPLLNILKKNNYRFLGSRGAEVLLCKEIRQYGVTNVTNNPPKD